MIARQLLWILLILRISIAVETRVRESINDGSKLEFAKHERIIGKWNEFEYSDNWKKKFYEVKDYNKSISFFAPFLKSLRRSKLDQWCKNITWKEEKHVSDQSEIDFK